MARPHWISHIWRRIQIGLLDLINRNLIRMEKLMKADKLSTLGIDPGDVLQNEDDVKPESSFYAINMTPGNYVLSINNGEIVYKIQPNLSAESIVVISGKYVRTPEVTAAQSKGDIVILKKCNLFAYRDNRLAAQSRVQANLGKVTREVLGDEYQREQAQATQDAYTFRLDNHRDPRLYANILKIMETADKVNKTVYGGAIKDDTYDKWKADYQSIK